MISQGLSGRLALLAAMVLLCGVGATLALWLANGQHPAQTIVNGDLRLVEEAPFTWQETTPSKTAHLASGTDLASLAGFLGVAGDEVELRYHVRTTLVGDNLRATLGVDWHGAAPVLPPGLAIAGYRVYDEDVSATLVDTTALGTQSQPDPLTSTGAAGSINPAFVVAVVVRWDAAAVPGYTSDFGTVTTPTLTSLPLTLGLHQVR